MDHRKLGRTTEHRIALLRNQAISLIKKDRIKTTVAKAKELRRFVEKLITLAKKDTLHARRIAAKDISDPEALKKLFATIGPLNAQRPGGYTRIIKAGFRKGDNAEEAIIELVGREPKFEDKTKKKTKKKEKTETPAEQKAEITEESPKETKETASQDSSESNAKEEKSEATEQTAETKDEEK
ncbi:MAG: 50S ribosomal protein L17 [Thermoanaerobaculaceae bacterium]|nr:50S ribosomal protein L17 [Thermoanaerobaculaceae bacterium]